MNRDCTGWIGTGFGDGISDAYGFCEKDTI